MDLKQIGDAAERLKKNPLAWGLLFAGIIIGAQYKDKGEMRNDTKEDKAEIKRLNTKIQFDDSVTAVRIDFIYARFMPVVDSAIAYMYKRASR